MQCLKCGKETLQSQVFCDDCQQTMEQYPVDPGTPVLIIPRSALRPEKDQRRKSKGYAETMRHLQKLVRRLSIALGVAALLIAVLSLCLFFALRSRGVEINIGQNYSIIDTNP